MIYRARPILLHLLSIAFILLFSYDTYKFYFAINDVSKGVDKEFELEIHNNSKEELNLQIHSINKNEAQYKRYFINQINIYEPNHLLQKQIIKTNATSSYKIKIPHSAFLLIKDINNGKGLKVYRTDIKMRLYASDFKNIDKIIKKSYWYEYTLILANFSMYFVIIFLFGQLPKRIITKIILLIPLLIMFIISSYNLYILVHLIGIV